MRQILIRRVKQDTVQRLKADARSHGRSLQSEVKRLLLQQPRMTRDEFIAWADGIRSSLPPQPGDSADLIREDRDSQ